MWQQLSEKKLTKKSVFFFKKHGKYDDHTMIMPKFIVTMSRNIAAVTASWHDHGIAAMFFQPVLTKVKVDVNLTFAVQCDKELVTQKKNVFLIGQVEENIFKMSKQTIKVFYWLFIWTNLIHIFQVTSTKQETYFLEFLQIGFSEFLILKITDENDAVIFEGNRSAAETDAFFDTSTPVSLQHRAPQIYWDLYKLFCQVRFWKIQWTSSKGYFPCLHWKSEIRIDTSGKPNE